MKILQFWIAVFSISVIMSCSSKPDRPEPAIDPATTSSTNITPPSNESPVFNTATTTQPGTVHHYICPNDCEGSGAAGAGTCPVCGSQYVHNQEFHNQVNTNTVTPVDNPTIQNPPTNPAQNANGVWHYTCSNGCAGGAGSAVACATCGTTLVHNAEYHNS